MSGQEIFLREEDLAPLEKGQFYLFQLEGCSVITVEGKKLGKVEDFQHIPDNPLLVVREAGNEFFIPFTSSICVEVDLGKRLIRINPPAGLLELNEI